MAHIEIENLTFSYPSVGRPSLSDVSLTIRRGEYVVLCGKSGSGKTTLLRHLKSVLAPHGKRSGDIRINGVSLKDTALGHLKKRAFQLRRECGAEYPQDDQLGPAQGQTAPRTPPDPAPALSPPLLRRI